MKIFLVSILIACFAHLSYAQTVDSYIEENLPQSQMLMREHQIPASIILAIAIHESAAGKSKIAQHMNNHFGIKGKNSSKILKSAYRDYPSVADSYLHFIEYLKTKKQYAPLFDKLNTYDYKAWAKGIHRGGYAASSSWARQIIATVTRYQLHQYDDYPEGFTPEARDSLYKVETIDKPAPLKVRIYTVKKNDNLSVISKKLGVSVNTLKAKNKLKSIVLQPGQKLKY